jgi:hypothetical protein
MLDWPSTVSEFDQEKINNVNELNKDTTTTTVTARNNYVND